MDQTIADHQLTGPVAKSITIEISEVVLNSHAMITVMFLDANGGCVRNEHFKMEGTDWL